MDQRELEHLRMRLRRLEGRLAVMFGAFIFSLVMLLVLGFLVPRAPSQPQVVRTRGVEVTDASGRLRISLDAVNDQPSLWLYDIARRRRVGLTVSKFGTPALVFNDEHGRSRISLSTGLERAAEVRLSDSNGRTRAGLWVTNQDEPGIWLFDYLTRPRIGLKVLASGEARVWIFENLTGQLIFSAP